VNFGSQTAKKQKKILIQPANHLEQPIKTHSRARGKIIVRPLWGENF